HQWHKTRTWKFCLDQREDSPCGADCDVYAKLLENLCMLRIIQAGDGAADFETPLSHLTDDKVIFIIAGDGNNDICAAHPHLFHRLGFTGITSYHRLAEFLIQGLVASCTFF